MSFLASGKKDKTFSAHNKIMQRHGDGSDTIIVMGRPFRVLQRIESVAPLYMHTSGNRAKHVEGKNAYVYLVENSSHLPEFPRHMALKRSFFNVDQVTEAHKEIDILARVKDKNIVRVYHTEITRSEGKLGVSIAMEYCGNHLERRIRSGRGDGAGVRMTESEICHVLIAMTSAVGYLHAQQPPIAHRDIRPENVLINNALTGPAAYRLCNFGSATTEAYQCETHDEVSAAIADIERHTSPAFRAPEMADPWSKRRICEKADLWSLGVLVYYMMYLQLPFKPNNMALSGNPRVKFPATGEGRYTSSLRNVVEHLLEPDPEKRWDIFALTTFLRFDEDISRHLGTYVFTETEWPEGWEEQDVKAIGREPPAKRPPVTYGEHSAGHARTTSGSGSSSSSNNNKNSNTVNRASLRSGAAGGGGKAGSSKQPHRTSGNGRGGDDEEEAALRAAMSVLGVDGAHVDAAELAQLLKEQEEAWERAKKQHGSGNAAHRASQDNNDNNDDDAAAPADNAAGTSNTPARDVFDDLFAGPVTSAPPSAAPAAQQQQQQQAAADAGRLSASELFGNATGAPAGMMMPGANMPGNVYGAAVPPQAATAMSAAAGYGWSTGMPAGMMAAMPATMPVAMGGGGGGGYEVSYAAGSNMTVPAATMPPPAMTTTTMMAAGGGGNTSAINFLAPAPGEAAMTYNNNNNASASAAATAAAGGKPASSKAADPFASLFS